jgi:hypothetical protein
MWHTLDMASLEEQEIRARLAAMDADVKIEAATKLALKEKARANVLARREKQRADNQSLRVIPHSERQDQLVVKTNKGSQLEVSKPKKQRNWIIGGGLSLFTGPVGWLYAGAWKEAVPAAAGWVVISAILAKLPQFLIAPVLSVALPVSAIIGMLYVAKFNKHGRRGPLFGEPEKIQEKVSFFKKLLGSSKNGDDE